MEGLAEEVGGGRQYKRHKMAAGLQSCMCRGLCYQAVTLLSYQWGIKGDKTLI